MSGIKRVGIVGAGTMGCRIAFSCVTHGVYVSLYDARRSAAELALERVRRLIEDRAATSCWSQADVERSMSRLSLARTLQGCVSSVDVVIEAVPENLEIKRSVFMEITAHGRSDVLLASNSSAIPGSWLSDVVRHPENLFNANFGDPDNPKVELMGHPGTAPKTLAAAKDFFQQIGLIPILLIGERVGYGLNRVWRSVKKDVLLLLEGGYLTAEDIDRGWMLDWGTTIGPCGLMDQVGLDVVRDIELIYFGHSGDPSDSPPAFLHKMIAEGKLGVKTNEGFYRYPNPEYRNPDWIRGGVKDKCNDKPKSAYGKKRCQS